MAFGHLGSAVAATAAVSMANAKSADTSMTETMSHGAASISHAAGDHQMAASMPECAKGHCAFCDGCASACVGLLFSYLSPLQYSAASFDAVTPLQTYSPILVFPFFRPPGRVSA